MNATTQNIFTVKSLIYFSESRVYNKAQQHTTTTHNGVK